MMNYLEKLIRANTMGITSIHYRQDGYIDVSVVRYYAVINPIPFTAYMENELPKPTEYTKVVVSEQFTISPYVDLASMVVFMSDCLNKKYEKFIQEEGSPSVSEVFIKNLMQRSSIDNDLFSPESD